MRKLLTQWTCNKCGNPSLVEGTTDSWPEGWRKVTIQKQNKSKLADMMLCRDCTADLFNELVWPAISTCDGEQVKITEEDDE